MIIHIIRALYILVVVAFTVSFAFGEEVWRKGANYVTLYILLPVLLAFGLVMVDMFWRRKRLGVLSGLFFGVIAGLVIAYVLAQIVGLVGGLIDPNLQTAGAAARGLVVPSPAETGGEGTAPRAELHSTLAVIHLIKLLLGTSAVFMCVSFVLQTKDDFRFVIPYVEFSRQTKGARPLLLDTSVIIDGRIADITDTQILESEMVVPRFVLAELQSIADSDDKLRRNRGRRGLDILNRLQGSEKVDIKILDAHVPDVEEIAEVDAKLVALARHLDGKVMTNDYNLNKIAKLRGVEVININDLANALKPIVLPGETLNVKVIKPGEEAGQGVGYLDDGTMVVAEQGRDYVGREIAITVTSVLQTSAGRMIFGKLDPDKTHGVRKRSGQ